MSEESIEAKILALSELLVVVSTNLTLTIAKVNEMEERLSRLESSQLAGKN